MTPKRFTGASPDPSVEAQLEALLTRLYGFYHKEIDLNLDRAYRFLERLSNPHLRLPRVVHLAGTNGKGSTLAILRALFEASGHKVHCYTSPHLTHITERIVLAGNPIASEALLALLNECIEINQDEPITFFELFTCAAFLAFARTPADILLLETGMGGRLDTTNVVPHPAATVITTISCDHTGFLGSSFSEIALEKAGIMKKSVPCVIGRQIPEAIEAGIMEVFQKRSQDLSPEAKLVRFGAEWSSEAESGRMLFRYGNDSIATSLPSLSGNHQIWNAGAALAAFRLIAPEHFRPEILSTAMGRIHWPGRLQTLENHPYQAIAPTGWEIVIDGGHNDSCGLVLGEQMRRWQEADGRPLHLVVAMLDRKDPVAFLKPLLPYAASLTATRVTGEESSFAPAKLAAIARDMGFPAAEEADSPEEALALIAARAAKAQAKTQAETAQTAAAMTGINGGGDLRPVSPARILMTGSLFFMGNILSRAPGSAS